MRGEKPLIGVGFVRNAKQKVLPNLHSSQISIFFRVSIFWIHPGSTDIVSEPLFFTEINFLLSNSFHFLRL